MIHKKQSGFEKRTGGTVDLWMDEAFKFHDTVAEGMNTYASILKMWEPPRCDSIRAYGLVAAPVYSEIATGKPSYADVAGMLSACSAKGLDPNVLRKRVKYYRQSFPEVYAQLKSSLESDHQSSSYYPEPDLDKLLTKLEKSHP
jgi:hypothetical protein